MQGWLWVAGAALAMAALSGLAEHRRSQREGMARIGWAPWSGLVVLALFVFAGAVAYGLHAA